MSNETKRLIGWVIVVIAIVVAGFLGVVYPIPAPPVAPAPAPAVESQAALPRLIAYNSTGITVTTNFAAFQWYRGTTPFTAADVYYNIDQGTTNTITLKLQVSPDNSAWIDYVAKAAPGITDGAATITSTIIADASGYVVAPIHLQYFRVVATVTNSELVTPTIKVFLR